MRSAPSHDAKPSRSNGSIWPDSARADQGHAKAQYNLGVMYGKGRGIPKDYVQAPMWYNLAASRFAPGSSRDKAVKNRATLAERMTPAQSAEAQRLAREWKSKPE